MERKEFSKYNKTHDDIEWSAYEFEYHKKDQRWFLIFWIISGGIFFSSIILGNIFGAATLALFSIIIYMYTTKEPEKIKCRISSKGLLFNDRLFPFNSLSSFWIFYENDIKKLIIISNYKMMPKIEIPLGDANPVKIREILIKNGIEEKEEEESISDIIARKLRF
jgi:hypothetical protein